MNKTDDTASPAILCTDLTDQTSQGGGGTLLYISSSLTHNILLNTSDDTLESTWCDVTTNQESITIGCVYRPPNSPHNIALQTLEQCIRRTKLNTNHTIIVGDLNAKNNAWLATDKTDAAGDELRDLFRLYGLEQLVDFPTYLYRGTLFSCIDIVATDIDCSTISVTSAAPIGGSDHLFISVHITSPPQPHPPGPHRTARNALDMAPQQHTFSPPGSCQCRSRRSSTYRCPGL